MGSPASGENSENKDGSGDHAARVSNLLGSPASGELRTGTVAGLTRKCFQFIGFPSEWGGEADARLKLQLALVSNLLGSPASGEELL